MDVLTQFIDQPITWLVIVYVLVKDVLPKLAPDLFQFLGSKKSTEDRLFSLLEKNNEALDGLRRSNDTIALTLQLLDKRVGELERLYQDDGTRQFIAWFKTLKQYRDLHQEDASGSRTAKLAE